MDVLVAYMTRVDGQESTFFASALRSTLMYTYSTLSLYVAVSFLYRERSLSGDVGVLEIYRMFPLLRASGHSG